MATDKGNRPADSKVCSETVEQKEIVQGWCTNCLCKNGYHIGDSAGVCLDCNCAEFAEDDEADILDRFKVLILGQIEDDGVIEEEEEEPCIIEPSAPVLITKTGIYIGISSRTCMVCGRNKMYQEFGDSKDPKVLCNYCAWQEAYEQEIDTMEDEILENEMAYEEALERQEMIDEVLRGLDE